MEKTAKETHDAIKRGCEAAKGKLITVSSDDVLAALAFAANGKTGKVKIES